MPDPSAIAYAAHTDAGTFLLDEDGFCRGFVPSPDQSGSFRVKPEAADRCIGAQYVASIDMTEPGALVALPRIGAALLFGVIEENRRIALVRTGPLLRFETLEKKDERLAEAAAAAGTPAPEKPKASEFQLDVTWDDESTAVAPVSSAPRPTATATAASASAPASPKAPPSDPFQYELDKTPLPDTDEPTTLRFRPSQLLRAASSGKPADPPSGPFSDEPPTPATLSIRRAVALGIGSSDRLVGPDDETIERKIAVESSGRRG